LIDSFDLNVRKKKSRENGDFASSIYDNGNSSLQEKVKMAYHACPLLSNPSGLEPNFSQAIDVEGINRKHLLLTTTTRTRCFSAENHLTNRKHAD
jgi:hypothetical protein